MFSPRADFAHPARRSGQPRRGMRRPVVAKNAASGHRQSVTTRIFCAKSA
uniref:Uncharacterized protein n=1 Tax=virus sp. ct6GG30 TaxID=2825804 RepID=A0A8S5RKJ9_9VIRU|nr:MAG TPA: hypothetical protein [virus sp. ct6GG30]